MRARGGALIAAGAAILAFATGPLRATSLEVTASRPIDLADTRLYVPLYGSFVAESDEALLTLSRATGDCTAPNVTCSGDGDCTSGVCRAGQCRFPESIRIGYVAVMRLVEFCNVAACGTKPLPPECVNPVCDGSACGVASSRVNGLCFCASCNETDPVLAAAEAPFVETFGDIPDPRWVIEQGTVFPNPPINFLKFLKPEYPVAGQPMSTPQIGLAQIRLFGLVGGQTYMVAVKWTVNPANGPTACPAYSSLSLSVAPVASVCAP